MALLEDHSIIDRDVDTSGAASSRLRLLRNGNLETFRLFSNGSWESDPNEYITSGKFSTAGDGYDVRLTKVSGVDPDVGVLATWQQVNQTRLWQWDVANPAASPKNFSGTLELRLTGVGSAIELSTISINVVSL